MEEKKMYKYSIMVMRDKKLVRHLITKKMQKDLYYGLCRLYLEGFGGSWAKEGKRMDENSNCFYYEGTKEQCEKQQRIVREKTFTAPGTKAIMTTWKRLSKFPGLNLLNKKVNETDLKETQYDKFVAKFSLLGVTLIDEIEPCSDTQ